jgi:hypothetical protein
MIPPLTIRAMTICFLKAAAIWFFIVSPRRQSALPYPRVI